MVFLLAHQDDEFMVAPIIRQAKDDGRRVAIAYLTSGDGGAAEPALRNRELRKALQSLGVDVETEVAFLGEQHCVSDGELVRRLPALHEAVMLFLAKQGAVDRIYVHAWEGGNPDHDAAHALALGVAKVLRLVEPVLQVPFYRAPRRGPLPFVLFAPLAANGDVTVHRLGLSDRLRRLSLMRFYPSQRRTFVRFFPLLLLDAVLQRGVALQASVPGRLRERPMPERLRYERIGYIEFKTMAPLIAAYWQSICEPSDIARPDGADLEAASAACKLEPTWKPVLSVPSN